MDYGKCYLRLPYSILLFLFFISFKLAGYDNPSCIARVNVSLDDRGIAQLYPNMFVLGSSVGYSIEVMDSPLANKTIVDCSFIGKEVMVNVIDNGGGVCMSILNIEDKTVYALTARDTLLNCLIHLDSIDTNSLLLVRDNCQQLKDFSISYVDIKQALNTVDNSDTLSQYLRIWLVKDASGIIVRDTSIISIKRFSFDEIDIPQRDTIYCSDDPYDLDLTGVPYYYNQDVMNSCGIMVSTSILDSVPQGCNKIIKYRRLWTHVDWESNKTQVDTQLIFKIDTNEVELRIPQLDNNILYDTMNCSYSLVIPEPEYSSMGCTTVPKEYLVVKVDNVLRSVGDTVNLYNDSFYLEYGGFDDCLNPLKEARDTLFIDIPSFAELDCPISSELLAISMDNDTVINVWAERLWTGTVLGCSNKYTLVGKKINSTCFEDTDFEKILKFCEDDISDTIDIEIGLMDSLGVVKMSTCIVQVVIQDKRAPLINCIDTLQLYLSEVDSMVLLDPLSLFVAISDNVALGSLTGSGSLLTGSNAQSGSGIMFSGGFNAMMSYNNNTGNLNFGCQDTGLYNLDLLVEDINANQSECNVVLEILDTLNICMASNTVATILAYNNAPMKDVKYITNYFSSFEITDESGIMDFGNIPNESIDVLLEYEDTWGNGITANDLYQLEQILIGESEIDVHDVVTADLNLSGDINGADYILLKKLLMSGSSEFNTSISPWLFYRESDFLNGEMPDGNNHMLKYSPAKEPVIVGSKIGDVDRDVMNVGSTRSTEVVTYKIRKTVNDVQIIFNMDGVQYDALQFDLIIDSSDEISTDNNNILLHKEGDRLRVVFINGHKSQSEDYTISLKSRNDIQELIVSNDLFSLKPTLFSNQSRSKLRLIREDLTTKNNNETFDFVISPNPGINYSVIEGVFTNESSDIIGEISIMVSDQLGRLILKETFNGERLSNIFPYKLNESITKGIYNVSVKVNESYYNKQYIKF